jgi:hypothetical protein
MLMIQFIQLATNQILDDSSIKTGDGNAEYCSQHQKERVKHYYQRLL